MRARRDAWQERAERAEADLAILAVAARWLLHLRDETAGLHERIGDETVEAVREVLGRVEERA